jgi:hypothetical protein
MTHRRVPRWPRFALSLAADIKRASTFFGYIDLARLSDKKVAN